MFENSVKQPVITIQDKVSMLKTTVKISNVTNLSDARYCAGMGVELIGFSMDDLSFEKYKEMRGWLSGVQIVGETESESILEIMELKETFLPDYIQTSNWQNLSEIKRAELPIILKVDYAKADLPALLRSTAQEVDYFLIENSDEFAHLDEAAISQLDALAFQYPVILGFGLSEDNVNEVLERIPLKGVALKGGEELKPGQRDYAELMDILEALESED